MSLRGHGMDNRRYRRSGFGTVTSSISQIKSRVSAAMTIFDQRYDFKKYEHRLRASWLTNPAYTWDVSLPPEIDYVIDTPPPTVSGTLHVGHVYSYTQADIIARFWRMRGRNVLYPIGWDDNGLPTERLVEKVKKVRGGSMAREEFVALCRQVIPEYEDQFRHLFSRLGLSVDWSREYQTISDESRAISQLSFLDLFDKGLLERRLEPTLWDPADRTAIAQAEVEELEQVGRLNTLAFALEDGGELEIATTRPELLGACAAVMIHPSHPRAGELTRTRAITPLYGALVPVIVDESVDPEKGTGVVMCCTFGDVTDITWWKTHKLPLRIVIDEGGKMLSSISIGNESWPVIDAAAAQATVAALADQKVRQARDLIFDMLRSGGFVRSQVETKQVIPIAERSGMPLEIIVTPQWIIKTLDYKEKLIEKGREINWHPAHMRQRFESWVAGLRWDWSISRQRHFGVPLPVWYSKRSGEEGRILLPKAAQLPVDPLLDVPDGYTADEVTPERDVLDTWATSSVSPQLLTRSVSPQKGLDPGLHERIFPMTMRPQAHEIIRTWAFYTIVKALHHEDRVPWREICVSGWCLASDGSKMSKSKGNIIDPVRLLDEHGADVLRYWTGTSRLGNDTSLSPNTLNQGKRLVTKLWNACKLAETALSGNKPQASSPRADIDAGIISHPLDLWLMGALSGTVQTATASFESYDYAGALRATEDFFWSDLCDNYLELVKYRLREVEGVPSAEHTSAQHTLLHAIRVTLRLFAPFMPYVTEAIAPVFALPGDSDLGIHARGTWPRGEELPEPGIRRELGRATIEAVSAMRKLKSSLDASVRAAVETMYIWGEPEASDCLRAVSRDLLEVSSAEQLTFGRPPSPLPETSTSSGAFSVALKMAERKA